MEEQLRVFEILKLNHLSLHVVYDWQEHYNIKMQLKMGRMEEWRLHLTVEQSRRNVLSMMI
jgi:hypothetical protein